MFHHGWLGAFGVQSEAVHLAARGLVGVGRAESLQIGRVRPFIA